MSLVLDSTRSIVVTLNAAKNTSDCDFVCSYADRNAYSFTEGYNDGNTNGITEVTLVAAPLSGNYRIIDEIIITNNDVVPVQINVKTKSSTAYEVFAPAQVLLPNDTWRWSKSKIKISSSYSGADSSMVLPSGDNSSIDAALVSWYKLQNLLNLSISSGTSFSTPIVSTYSLVYTVANAYRGGVLSPNGDIHFVPYYAAVGQKINSSGVVSTYSLVYTVTLAYPGGVLAPNGDIHFVPSSAAVGQKINSSGVVSTYSLVYTVAVAYFGGVSFKWRYSFYSSFSGSRSED